MLPSILNSIDGYVVAEPPGEPPEVPSSPKTGTTDPTTGDGAANVTVYEPVPGAPLVGHIASAHVKVLAGNWIIKLLGMETVIPLITAVPPAVLPAAQLATVALCRNPVMLNPLIWVTAAPNAGLVKTAAAGGGGCGAHTAVATTVCATQAPAAPGGGGGGGLAVPPFANTTPEPIDKTTAREAALTASVEMDESHPGRAPDMRAPTELNRSPNMLFSLAGYAAYPVHCITDPRHRLIVSK